MINVYGASGHAKVIIDILRSREIAVSNVLDDNPAIKEICGYPVLHEQEEKLSTYPYIVAIGNNAIRQKVTNKIIGTLFQAVSHKSSVVAKSAKLGDGTVAMANSIVNAEAVIGKCCIINSGAIVEHEVEIADYVHISPGAVLTGNVKVDVGTHIGAAASVIPGINIGKWATIGAGAVIIEDVPDYAVVVGNPGKIVKYNKV